MSDEKTVVTLPGGEKLPEDSVVCSVCREVVNFLDTVERISTHGVREVWCSKCREIESAIRADLSRAERVTSRIQIEEDPKGISVVGRLMTRELILLGVLRTMLIRAYGTKLEFDSEGNVTDESRRKLLLELAVVFKAAQMGFKPDKNGRTHESLLPIPLVSQVVENHMGNVRRVVVGAVKGKTDE